MTKETATILRDEYHQDMDSPTFVNYVVNAWLTNLQGTDIWFVDIETFNPHDNGGTTYFYKEGL
jgi:hypothetical protein